MPTCLAQEAPLKVGYLGPEGTYTHAAVLKYFGRAVEGVPLTTIEDVFQEVEAGNAEFGIVPIENSTEGTINHTLDMFMTSSLLICGEVELRIRHHLLGSMEELGAVLRVTAHPQALAQCRAWLRECLPQAELIPASSNAEGALRASGEAGTAAIAGDAAAEVYGLNKIAAGIEDRPDNTTRFFVIGSKASPASADDRTSLLLSASDTEGAGALYKLLAPLAADDVNMTRIESRPSQQRKWHYVFFIDIDGHIEEEHIARALVHLEQNAQLFRVLGSYPKATI
jgi:chorismate mutase/prephenate dehydratase